MAQSLLIVGAGTYALLTYEIACDMGVFDRIGFVDDKKTMAPTGDMVVGKTSDLCALSATYTDVIVAIGNPDVRLGLLSQIENDTNLHIASLISPKAYVALSATIAEGTVIEQFAVVHTRCIIERGCLISAGAVVNHESICEEGVHVDCNATIPGYKTVPAKTKVSCGMVYED